MPMRTNRGQQISVIAQENLKLAVFLLHQSEDAPLIGKLQEYEKRQYIC